MSPDRVSDNTPDNNRDEWTLDDVEVRITHPSNDGYVKSTDLTVRGTAKAILKQPMVFPDPPDKPYCRQGTECDGWCCSTKYVDKVDITVGGLSETIEDFTTTSWEHTFKNVSEGIKTINATAYYSGKSDSDSVSAIVDYTAPELISFSKPLENTGVVSPDYEVPVEVAFTDTNGPISLTYSLDGEDDEQFGGSFTLVGVSLGEHRITVKAWDAAGNLNTVVRDFRAVDDTAPALTIKSLSLDKPNYLIASWLGVSKEIEGTVSDDSSGIAGVEWELDASGHWKGILDEQDPGTEVPWEFMVPVLLPGTHKVRVRASDKAKNSTEVEITLAVVVPFAPEDMSYAGYVRDLINFAGLRMQKAGGGKIDAAFLKETYHQAFDEFGSKDLSDVAYPVVSQVRIAIEVLRSFLDKDKLDEEFPDYCEAAYLSMLANLGTSYHEIRLARGADEETRHALGKRLGITTDEFHSSDDPDGLDHLYLKPDEFTEVNLQLVFGLGDTKQNPLKETPEPPVLLREQRAYLHATWLKQDNAERAAWLEIATLRPGAPRAYPHQRRSGQLHSSAMPQEETVSRDPPPLIIDPDLIDEADFSPANDGNPAWVIWGDRKTTLEEKLDNLQDYHNNGFDAVVEKVLPDIDLQALADEHETQGGNIEPTLANSQLDLAGFYGLLRLRAVKDDLLPTEWDDVDAILLQVEKRRLLADWLDEEGDEDQPIALTPAFFNRRETPWEPLPWRASWKARRAWENKLDARFKQEAALLEAHQAALDATEASTLHLLRDALIGTIEGYPHIDMADWLTQRLSISMKYSADQKITRAEQAAETLQGVLFSVRTGRLQNLDSPPAGTAAPNWELKTSRTYKEKDFDAEWQWMGSYATWRGAMSAFAYPENYLLPTLLPDIDTRTAWEGLLDKVQDYKFKKAVDISEELNFEERDYYAPMLLGLALHRSGDYLAALDWFRQVYDYERPRADRKRSSYLVKEESIETRYVRNPVEWLLNGLNPHDIAATYRANAHTRFAVLSIVRTLLAFADSEFTRETVESVPQARRLYMLALELLDEIDALAPMQGPKAHWPFDEWQDTSAIDATGNGHDAELRGDAHWEPAGWRGGAISFNGADQFAQVPHAPALALGKDDADFSISFAMYLREGSKPWRRVMTKGSQSAGRTPAIVLCSGNNRLYFAIATTAPSPEESSYSQSEVEPGTWTHVAYVKQGRALKLYINGRLDGKRVLEGESVENHEPLFIGDDRTGAITNALFDEVQVFNYALSPAAVMALAMPAPIAHWPFDEDEGTIAIDATGNGHDATLVGDAKWNTAGWRGGAMSVSGYNDYAEVPHAPALALGKDDRDFSILFAIYLREQRTKSWRRLIRKGDRKASSQRTPGIFLKRKKNDAPDYVWFTINTDFDEDWEEGSWSKSPIQVDTWTHLAYVKEGRALKLYINGRLDAQRILKGRSVGYEQPLFIGGDPTYRDTSALIDEVQVFDCALSPAAVTALATNGPVPPYPFAPNPFPPNPALVALRQAAELNLEKIRSGRNIAGMEGTRTEPLAAELTVTEGVLMPARSVSFRPVSFLPTTYRYSALIERAKQLVSIAQQVETSYLASLEKGDSTAYTLFQAGGDVRLARERVELQGLRVTEADSGIRLAQKQQERFEVQIDTYQDWLDAGPNKYENNMLENYGHIQTNRDWLAGTEAAITATQAALSVAQMDIGDFITATGKTWAKVGMAAALATQAGFKMGFTMELNKLERENQVNAFHASLERRKDEWRLQQSLASKDREIQTYQIDLAKDQMQVAEKEQRIAQLQVEQAEASVEFLKTQFTNTDLYEWMSEVLGEVYSYFLQQATAMAQLAQSQLLFERQERVPSVIQGDYWQRPSGSMKLDSDAQAADRRGITGSARLLRDIYRLDQSAFEARRRKLQLVQTFSLARLAPFEFQRFRQTGVLLFATPMALFDQGFPGHYLRLIKRVAVSVAALIPPTQGIRATLSSAGLSRVVLGGDVFQAVEIRRPAEVIAFTSPSNATGVFDLQPKDELLLPFEGGGVDTSWQLEMPKAANPFDFNTIADVLFTIEYTALHSHDYREQVIGEMDRKWNGEAAYSLKRAFPDVWYNLHHPDTLVDESGDINVSFETRRDEFPRNVDNVRIDQILLSFAESDGAAFGKIAVKDLRFKEQGAAEQAISYGGAETSEVEHVISTRRANGAGWRGSGSLPDDPAPQPPLIGKSPTGTWTLAFPNSDEFKSLFVNDQVADILFVISCAGETPAWPT